MDNLTSLASPSCDPSVGIAVIYNPLEPADRALGRLVWRASASLADYLDGLPDHIDWAAVVNGEIVARDLWPTTFLRPDDLIAVLPVLHGGQGGGKAILRIVAMVAVAALATWAGPALAGAMQAGTAVGGVVTGTLTAAGRLSLCGSLPEACA
jgi:sulfur carrier protein ThiS